MNWAICKNTWKELKSNKLRAVLLTAFLLLPIIESTTMFCVEGEFPQNPISKPAEVVIFFVLIWGIGTIGRQVSDGTLSLVLSRPLTVTSYVFSKWFAVATAAAVISVIQLALEVIVGMFRDPTLIDLNMVIVNGAERIILGIGLSAFIVLLSSLVSGVKDLGLYLLLKLIAIICGAIAGLKADNVAEGVARYLASAAVYVAYYLNQTLDYALAPQVQLMSTFGSSFIVWSTILAFLTMIAVCLSLSIFRLNRRELPYGSD